MTDITITKGARLAALGLLILVLIVGGGNLWATHSEIHSAQVAQQQEQAAQRKQAAREQAAQRRQGEEIERKLCATFGGLAARNPPVGAPGANPSRAYLQWLHGKLSEVAPDIDCGKLAGSPR